MFGRTKEFYDAPGHSSTEEEGEGREQDDSSFFKLSDSENSPAISPIRAKVCSYIYIYMHIYIYIYIYIIHMYTYYVYRMPPLLPLSLHIVKERKIYMDVKEKTWMTLMVRCVSRENS